MLIVPKDFRRFDQNILMSNKIKMISKTQNLTSTTNKFVIESNRLLQSLENVRKSIIEQQLPQDEFFHVLKPDNVAVFSCPTLRYKNEILLHEIVSGQSISNEDVIQFFAQLHNSPFRSYLALKYHGYQFGIYNNRIGDGRALLLGQYIASSVTDTEGEFKVTMDVGVKGTGRTPFSRGNDGKLTLSGGIREVLGAEILNSLNIPTQRALVLVETNSDVYRENPCSPEEMIKCRGCVIGRSLRSSIRFGTFEKLYHDNEKDKIPVLCDYVIRNSYPQIEKQDIDQGEKYVLWYNTLVIRIASLVSKWNLAGFVHGVVNTDNMSVAGETIDLGPFGFIETYDASYTPASFDIQGRYSFANQKEMCKWNLQMLQKPLAHIIDQDAMNNALEKFDGTYWELYRNGMLNKLGFELNDDITVEDVDRLVQLTIHLLQKTQIGYVDFFAELQQCLSQSWIDNSEDVLSETSFVEVMQAFCPKQLSQWKQIYHQLLTNDQVDSVMRRLAHYNAHTSSNYNRDIQEIIDEVIQKDNWDPFHDMMSQLQALTKQNAKA